MKHVREQICREAARLMAEEGVLDHQSAKSKAIDRLNLPANSELPDNREIETALIEYLEIFQVMELASRRKRWRQTALNTMKQLSAFEPRLIGATLSGVLTRFSHIQILIQSSPEILSIFLHDENVDYDQGEKRFRLSSKGFVHMPMFQFVLDDLDIELICLESDIASRMLVCPISGKTLKSGSEQDLEKLLAEH